MITKTAFSLRDMCIAGGGGGSPKRPTSRHGSPPSYRPAVGNTRCPSVRRAYLAQYCGTSARERLARARTRTTTVGIRARRVLALRARLSPKPAQIALYPARTNSQAISGHRAALEEGWSTRSSALPYLSAAPVFVQSFEVENLGA